MWHVDTDPMMAEPTSMPGISDRTLHRIEWHMLWEYTQTWAPVGDWPGKDTAPEGEGWVRNVEAGDGGYEVLKRVQVSYWRRPKR